MTHRRRFATCLFTASLLAATTISRAEPSKDWPQFHGPNRDNVSRETGLLQQWPKAGPPLAWKAEGIGHGFSSVAVASGKVFTAGDGEDSSYVFALNESDGKPIWKSKLGRTGGNYAGTRATPTIDGDLVYVLGQFGDLACYQAAEGKEVWRTNLNTKLGGHMMSGWGNSESIIIEGQHVLCTPGGKQGTLAALDKKTGEAVWRSKELTDNAAYMAPVIAEIGGVRQAVVLTDQSVAGIAVADGKVLWRQDRPGQTAVIPTPVVKDNYVYVTSGYGVGCDLFKIIANGSSFKVETVYAHNNVMENHHGGVILVNGFIYGHSDHGGWTCQEFMTGKPKWQDNKILGKGTLSYADGRFYLRAEQRGTLMLLEADPEHHVQRGRFEQPDRTNDAAWPHLVIANGKLYVRDQDLLLAYDVKGK
jgi:outer membrane protein assembly factor BamB